MMSITRMIPRYPHPVTHTQIYTHTHVILRRTYRNVPRKVYATLEDGLPVQGQILLDTFRVTGIGRSSKRRMASVDPRVDDMDVATATRRPVIIGGTDGLGDARQQAEAGADLGRGSRGGEGVGLGVGVADLGVGVADLGVGVADLGVS